MPQKTRRNRRARSRLASVGRKAVKDPAFWRKLRADPDAALESAGIRLSSGDLVKLKDLLSKKAVEVDLDRVVRMLRGTIRDRPPLGWTWMGWIDIEKDW